MPFTFLSHQAPVLPLVERNPDRWDGVALVAGSMAPDLAYVTLGWGYGPHGIPLWFDGHRLGNLQWVTLGAVVLAVVVRWLVLPVAPLAVPDAGVFHLHDYRNLADRWPRWWITVVSAFVGVLTHLALDSFTHPDGFVVRSVGLLRISLFTVGGLHLHVYSLLQTVGSVVLGAVAVWQLVRLGRARAFAAAGAPAGEAPVLGRPQRRAFWGILALGAVAGLAYAAHRSGSHVLLGQTIVATKSTVFIAGCWVMFVALVVACVVLRPAARRAVAERAAV